MGRKRKKLIDPIEHIIDWQRRSRFPDDVMLLMKVSYSANGLNKHEDMLIGVIDAKRRIERNLSSFIREIKKEGLSNVDISSVIGVDEKTIRNKSEENG